ncbi:MAG: hypothetical protein JO077_16000 [Verrucomicrobia bacterium]|nr:hypothetical protein [Verrucomicrobiota bacterium]
MKMQSLIFAFVVVFPLVGLCAETSGWQPAAGHTQIPIWPGPVPDARPLKEPETATNGKQAPVRCGQTMGFGQPSFSAYDYRLFAGGKEYRSGDGGFSRRRLLDSGHRS